MPVFFFALSQTGEINWIKAVICFFVLHLFIYPASNGYNSFMDQDVTPIGGLENPPMPTKQLFYASLILDATGMVLALFISLQFCLCVFLYILASRAYSYKGIRLKKYAIPGFLTVVLFQGAFTFWMVINGIGRNSVEMNTGMLLALTGCSFLIGGVYPLTQIYQHEADISNGDFSISSKLGVTGTFLFTAIMFLFANGFLFFYFDSTGKQSHFVLFQIFLLPVIIYFITWFLKTIKNKSEASFKNTMRMNLIASTCMNACFILLLILNLNP